MFEGRDIVLAAGAVQSRTPLVPMLRWLGVGRILVIGTMGTGPVPDAEVVLVSIVSTDAVDEFRAWERIATDPPAHVVEALDRFPDALLLFNGFEAMTSFGGRPAFGARPAEWTALEDKTTVDALWDDIGVARPRSLVVPVRDAWAAHALLDAGDGTVWSGDSSQGFNGGGIFVHWVRTSDDAAAASAHLDSRCARVRVVPFVEGIPCSIHGFVTHDGVAVLRPVELLTLRAAKPPWFRMCGCATTYDPAPSDRDEMRGVARRVGAALRDLVGYRGWFTIDGIMSAVGWRPTELNPRPGAGLVQLRPTGTTFPSGLANLAVIAGAIEVDAVAMEAELLPLVDAHRLRLTQLVVSGRHQAGEETVERDGATMTLGPSTAGAFLRITFDESTVPVGEPFAPMAAAAIGWADEHWSLGTGPLTPARPVR